MHKGEKMHTQQVDRNKGIYGDSWAQKGLASKDEEIKALRELLFRVQAERDRALTELRAMKDRFYQGGSIK